VDGFASLEQQAYWHFVLITKTRNLFSWRYELLSHVEAAPSCWSP